MPSSNFKTCVGCSAVLPLSEYYQHAPACMGKGETEILTLLKKNIEKEKKITQRITFSRIIRSIRSQIKRIISIQYISGIKYMYKGFIGNLKNLGFVQILIWFFG